MLRCHPHANRAIVAAIDRTTEPNSRPFCTTQSPFASTSRKRRCHVPPNYRATYRATYPYVTAPHASDVLITENGNRSVLGRRFWTGHSPKRMNAFLRCLFGIGNRWSAEDIAANERECLWLATIVLVATCCDWRGFRSESRHFAPVTSWRLDLSSSRRQT